MPLPSLRSASALVSFVVLLLFTAVPRAHAFCRTRTAEPTENCPTECDTEGLPLFWANPEITYAFNEQAFAGISEADLRAAFARAFATWTDAECDGMQTGLRVEAQAATTPLTVGPKASEPNLNVISVLSQREWEELGNEPNAYAKTKIWFVPSTGEIVGADMAFNGSIGEFAVCPAQSCPASVIDIENVATHEAGHFLGLGHSTERDATMWCDADSTDRSKRSLTPDDVDGMCAIYADGSAFEAPASGQPKHGQCDASPGAPRELPSTWLLALAGLLVARFGRARAPRVGRTGS